MYAGVDPRTGKDIRVQRTVAAPHTRAGKKVVDKADAATAPSAPPSQITPPAPDALAGALGRIEELDPDFGMFIRLAATTGARRSQLCALRWSDVDPSGATVTFARGVVDGGPGVGLVEKPTKTGQIWKVALAPGNTGTAKRLEDFRAVCDERAEAVSVELPADGFVFAVPADGSIPWRPDNVSARWRRLRSKVGLDGCRLHDYADVRVVPTSVVGALAA